MVVLGSSRRWRGGEEGEGKEEGLCRFIVGEEEGRHGRMRVMRLARAQHGQGAGDALGAGTAWQGAGRAGEGWQGMG